MISRHVEIIPDKDLHIKWMQPTLITSLRLYSAFTNIYI